MLGWLWMFSGIATFVFVIVHQTSKRNGSLTSHDQTLKMTSILQIYRFSTTSIFINLIFMKSIFKATRDTIEMQCDSQLLANMLSDRQKGDHNEPHWVISPASNLPLRRNARHPPQSSCILCCFPFLSVHPFPSASVRTGSLWSLAIWGRVSGWTQTWLEAFFCLF